MAKLSNEFENRLRVIVVDRAPVYIPRDGQRNKFEMQTLSQVTWYGSNLDGTVRQIEFYATPIGAMDLPQGLFGFNDVPSEYENSSWYFLEKINPEHRSPDCYLAHSDYLIPLNAEYPTIISMLPHLQEKLALAQVEAAKLAQHSDLRLGVVERLMAHLTNIGVNIMPRR